MKKLLTCLAYVYALVLVPNSVAAQTIWKYYYLGEANNWTASAAEDSKYHFGQTSSTTDVITWTLTLSGSQLDYYDKNGNAYFAVHVKTDATGVGNIFRMGPDNKDYDITTLGSGSVSKNDNSFLLRNVDQNALYKLTFVSNAGRESGTLSVEKKAITIRGALKDNWGDCYSLFQQERFGHLSVEFYQR